MGWSTKKGCPNCGRKNLEETDARCPTCKTKLFDLEPEISGRIKRVSFWIALYGWVQCLYWAFDTLVFLVGDAYETGVSVNVWLYSCTRLGIGATLVYFAKKAKKRPDKVASFLTYTMWVLSVKIILMMSFDCLFYNSSLFSGQPRKAGIVYGVGIAIWLFQYVKGQKKTIGSLQQQVGNPLYQREHTVSDVKTKITINGGRGLTVQNQNKASRNILAYVVCVVFVLVVFSVAAGLLFLSEPNKSKNESSASATATNLAKPDFGGVDAGEETKRDHGLDDSDAVFEALKLRARADQGDAEAQFELGRQYLIGKSVEKQSYEMAAYWYQKAAAQTNADALLHLGMLYCKGLGVPCDQQKGLELIRQAGDQGDAKLQYLIGVMFGTKDEKLLPYDPAEAAYWFHEAALQSHVESQKYLGVMYYFGKGVQRDFVEAARWLQEPAEQGDMKAQRLLGSMYELGQGVDKNLAEAARWYRKAADQGDEQAQTFLGSMYIFGDGVVKDMVEAAHWLRKAAEQGSAYAQRELGKMYYRGMGVVKDPKQAYIWLLIASSRGLTDCEELIERVEADAFLTPSDIREARTIAREWRPRVVAVPVGERGHK